VIEGRQGDAGRADLEFPLCDIYSDIVSITSQQASIAIDACRQLVAAAIAKRYCHRPPAGAASSCVLHQRQPHG
jgi:hypothetical protein